MTKEVADGIVQEARQDRRLRVERVEQVKCGNVYSYRIFLCLRGLRRVELWRREDWDSIKAAWESL